MTNYYLTPGACPHCGEAPEPLHLGKHTYDWCFALHVYPAGESIGVPTWLAESGFVAADWMSMMRLLLAAERSLAMGLRHPSSVKHGQLPAIFGSLGWRILDEYGLEISLKDFSELVAGRHRSGSPRLPLLHALENALPGPRGLARRRLWPGHIVGHHPVLPIDYCVGEFS